jgi:ATP-dependent helicase/nuclease subunit B
MQRGSLIHYVLDRIVSKYKKEIKNLSNGEIVREVNAQTEEYLDSIVGYRSIETPRLKYLVSTMKRSLYRVVERIRDEFKQSEFEPIHCELKIGLGGDMKDIEIPLEDGAVLSLNGVVDRIDGWNGYIRIVDYKTGSRTFKLPDVLFGQNMQMLLYLYSLVKTGSFGKKSAGILYMPAKRNLGKDKASKRMNGLLVSNTEVISAMEKENSGEFVPKLSEKNPSSSFIKEEDFDTLFEFITKKLQNSGNKILSGEISPNPIDGLDSGACKYCDFGAICRIKNEKHQAVPRLSNNQIMEEMRKEE